MKKLLLTLGWITGGFGGLMMLIGAVAVLAGGILANHHWTNYFFPGCAFAVLGIFLFVGVRTTFDNGSRG